MFCVYIIRNLCDIHYIEISDENADSYVLFCLYIIRKICDIHFIEISDENADSYYILFYIYKRSMCHSLNRNNRWRS